MIKALIVAGGNSTRMGQNKLLLKINGLCVIEKVIEVFCKCNKIDEIILATNDKTICSIANKVCYKPLHIANAGKERQHTVENGLKFVNDDDIVLIHDGARPFLTIDLINRCIQSCKEFGSGVAAYPIYDSIKKVEDDIFVKNIDRTNLYTMQTPQGFLGKIIKKAHSQNDFGTDDAYLVSNMGEKVRLVMGEKENIKLTTKDDIPKNNFRIGQGYDVHKLVKDRKLILCGVEIPYEFGLLGHSDADVATHALMDAILGAIGCFDIGRAFPDDDDSYKGISSLILLEKVKDMMYDKGYELVNCDVTIVAQKPKLLPYIDAMKENICKILCASESNINVKATTTEHLGFEGRKEGISAMAVVMVKGV